MRFGLATLTLTLPLAVACSGDDGGSDAGAPADAQTSIDAGAEPTDSGVEIEDAGGELDAGELEGPTWTRVQALFQSECSPCHDPGNVDRRTVMSDYDSIVDAERNDFTYVVPGDPQASFVFRKIEQTQTAYCQEQMVSTFACGGRMPPRGRNPLTAAQVELVRDWILDGAPEN